MGLSALIVEDDRAVADLASRILASEGWSVLQASDGRQGLAALERRRFDLALVDILLPEMTGAEMVRAMKADERYRHIPVLLMTGAPQAIPRENGLYEGVLRKPFSRAVLLAVVELVLPEG